jgi:hypothetical protein
VPTGAVAAFVLAASLCGLEAYLQSVGAALVFAALAFAIAVRIVRECSAAVALLLNAPFEQASSGVTEAPELSVARPPLPRDAGVAIERGPAYFRADGRR